MIIDQTQSPALVVAEVGCNHQGKLELAREMIQVAAFFCKVDVIKFQKRTVRELLTPEEYARPHPVPEYSFGETYGRHRDALEFSVDQHRQLKQWCEESGVQYSTSVWDLTAAKEIAALQPKFLKIPSASNLDFNLLGWLCDHYAGELHVSLGMTERKEEDAIVRFLDDRKRLAETVLYACTSGYPVPFEDVCVLEVTRLQHTYGSKTLGIGFSGHHLGIAADIAALTLGARYFERHFTLDRTLKGTDHAASLEPDGMRKLARDLRNVSKTLRFKESELLPIEISQREKLKRAIER